MIHSFPALRELEMNKSATRLYLAIREQELFGKRFGSGEHPGPSGLPGKYDERTRNFRVGSVIALAESSGGALEQLRPVPDCNFKMLRLS